jgi:predicted TIM-barrel fold metal-dependent hydrolase
MDATDFDLIPIPLERKVAADAWLPPSDIVMISADDHNLETDHLFEERLPAKFKDRAPKLWRDPETRIVHVEIGGKSFDPPGIGTIGHECPGFWDVGERLKAMDSERIYGSVLYHGQLQSLNAILGSDPELYFACMEVYNEWLIDFLKPAGNRLVGVAMLPSFVKPETARDQVQKIKGLGYKTMQMPSYPRGIRYNSREMDPIWAALVEAELPLSFHVTAFQEFSGYGSLGANVSRNMSPFRPLLGQLIFSGVFDRFPDLKVVFAEGGIAWTADAIASMDRVFRAYYTILKPKLEHMPSHYWYKNCMATFMDDPVGIELMHHIHADNVMWSIDYPHPESCYGYAGDVAKSVYDAVGHEDAKKILGDNAIKLYGFHPPADWGAVRRAA